LLLHHSPVQRFAVERKKIKLVLNKPQYIGMAVLDLSKELMYDFYYNMLQKHHGIENLKLLFSDTDSVCMEITTQDYFSSIKALEDFYDLSNFPKDHYMYSAANKKVPGKMKIETADEIVHEFVGLKPKMYSVLYGTGRKQMKKAKGVNTCVVKRRLRHQDYLHCLQNHQLFKHRMKRIGSVGHKVYTIEQQKISLSPYDDKRYILDDGINSVPYGYCCK